MIGENGKRIPRTPFVVTQGVINFWLLEALLKPEFNARPLEHQHEDIHIAWANDWSEADSLARSIQVSRRAPVALVVNADSLDPEGRYDFLQVSLGQYGTPGQWRAVVVTPAVERLLFAGNGEIVEALAGEALTEAEKIRAEYEPRRIFEQVMARRGIADVEEGFRDGRLAFDKIPLNAARNTPEIRDLTEFLRRFTKGKTPAISELVAA